MKGRILSASILTTAIGLAIALQTSPVEAQNKMSSSLPKPVQDNMARAKKNRLEKCYGINAVAKNDCAEGAHSCAGQATKERDPKSFVLLPSGDCEKIAGGTTKAM